MSDFLVNLARRGAGLASHVAPQPPFSLSFVPEVGAARTVSAPEARDEANAHPASATTPPPAPLSHLPTPLVSEVTAIESDSPSQLHTPPTPSLATTPAMTPPKPQTLASPAITLDVNAIHAAPSPKAGNEADAHPATKMISQMQASPPASGPPLTTVAPQPASLPHSPLHTPPPPGPTATEPDLPPQLHTPPTPSLATPIEPTARPGTQQPQPTRYPTPKPEIDPAATARLASAKRTIRSSEHAPHDTPIRESKAVRPQSAGRIAELARPPQNTEKIGADQSPAKASAGKKHPSIKVEPAAPAAEAANQVVIRPTPVIEHPPVPLTPRPPAAAKPEPRPVHVRIGTIEVRATTPSPPPPAPPPSSAPQGFDNYVSIRTYTSWEMD